MKFNLYLMVAPRGWWRAAAGLSAAAVVVVGAGCESPARRTTGSGPASSPSSAAAAPQDSMGTDQADQKAAEDAESFEPRPEESEERTRRPPDVRSRRAVDQPRVRPR